MSDFDFEKMTADELAAFMDSLVFLPGPVDPKDVPPPLTEEEAEELTRVADEYLRTHRQSTGDLTPEPSGDESVRET
jgi:hypothetical protein